MEKEKYEDASYQKLWLQVHRRQQQLANREEKHDFFMCNLFQTKGTLGFSLQTVTQVIVEIICTWPGSV